MQAVYNHNFVVEIFGQRYGNDFGIVVVDSWIETCFLECFRRRLIRSIDPPTKATGRKM